MPIHNGRFLTGARLVLTALREMRSIRAFARLQVLSGFGELARAGFIAATGVECSVANSLRLIRLHFADAQNRKRLAYITELPVERRAAILRTTGSA